MQHLLGAEFVLEHVGGIGEGLVDVAGAHLVVERDVGALGALEVLQVGEGAGGLELLVHQDLVLGRLDLVEHRRQLVVLGDDQRRGLVGDMGVLGEHHGDRLADVVHLVDREDRLVVERRAVIGVRDDLAHVLGGHHPVDARHGACAALVSIERMRPWATVERKYLAEQHARQAQIVSVFGASGDFLAGLEPRRRAADLAAGGRCGRYRHQWLAPLVPSSAWRTARRT